MTVTRSTPGCRARSSAFENASDIPKCRAAASADSWRVVQTATISKSESACNAGTCAIEANPLIGGGTSASFGPVIADISLWFAKHHGVAVAICSSGSYLAGTVWPLVIQPLAQWVGWRHTYFGIAVFCRCSMLPLLLALRRRLPRETGRHSAPVDSPRAGAFAGGGNGLQLLLMLAGLACCIAMAMPQVHIVAYCTDLGYGPRARRGDAVADVRDGHYQPALLRLDRRPHRGP